MKVVFCPFAGGTKSSYNCLSRYWSEIDTMTLDYKGRDGQDTYKDFKQAVKDCLKQCFAFVGEDEYAIFGHSMGTFIAWEVAYQMQYIYDHPPVKILISGEPSPRPGRCMEEFEGDEELKQYLKEMGGTEESLIEDRIFIKSILNRMRGDFHLLNTYEAKNRVLKLDSDMIWMYGNRDKQYDADTIELWQKKVSGRFDRKIFEGGHFYFFEHPQQFADFIENNLRYGNEGYFLGAQL